MRTGRRAEATGFGGRLRELRRAAGYSQAALARKVDVHRNTIINLESGANDPAWPLVLRLAEALGVSTEAFRPPDPLG